MKKLIKKCGIFVTVVAMIVLFTIPTVQAKGLDNVLSKQELVSEETIEKDGLYITVSIFEDKQTKSDAIPYSSIYEKSGKKTYTAKNADKETLFSFTVYGSFTVNTGISASCTKSSYSYSIANNAWELKTASTQCSGNRAVGNAEFIKKLLFVTVDTFDAHIVLNCDSNGNLS